MNNLTQPFLVFGTPCTSWEQTQTALLAFGVPHNQLGQWHNLYRWADIENALQGGWDPEEEIEKYLTPFLESLGSRKFRCVAPVRSGNPGYVCGWEGTKKDRAISHVCGHFGYNAWICNGQCGRSWCTQRFAEKRNLDQHAKPDSVHCPNCDKLIEHKRNLRKHMDNCG